MMIVRNTINKGSLILKKNSINSNLLDAELILSNIMKVDRKYLLLNDNLHVSKENRKKYYHAIKRRSKKEPVAYILGKREFWSIDFPVNKSVLIPRPETELLIHEVIKFIKSKKINILDIGTGCGCILISLLKEFNLSKGVGLDISSKAINLASKNAKKLNILNRASFKVGDIDSFFYGKYDLIVSNPPYIAIKELKNLSKEITNYEPLSALNGGIDGLDLIRKVIYKSKKLLKKSGILAIEIGNNQYKQVSKILIKDGYKEVSKVYDFNNNVRCIISTK
jgi:release factor glutamine methyltransferase